MDRQTGDNQSVVTNASRSESVLKKKHVSICYHCVRELCAADIIRIAHESTKTNLADLLTKNLDGHRIQELVSRILY
jgi:protein required for attachment to host cells